jgi:agarase
MCFITIAFRFPKAKLSRPRNKTLRHPNIVGCHWFSYRDEPTTDRTLDGENYQNGFVDVTDTPYTETIQAAREIGYHLYEIRSAPEPPSKQVASNR